MVGRSEIAERFEALYASNLDPWNYATDPSEHQKYSAILAALPRARYHRALEIGCSEGVFSELAASRAVSYLGIDISQTALNWAIARCSRYESASFRRVDLLSDELHERFDLIFCSETLYYVPPPALHAVTCRIASWLEPGGDLVLAHATGDRTRDWPDTFGGGGAARLHRWFSGALDLPVLVHIAQEGYEIDVVRMDPNASHGLSRAAERLRLEALNAIPTTRWLARRTLVSHPRAGRLVHSMRRRSRPT